MGLHGVHLIFFPVSLFLFLFVYLFFFEIGSHQALQPSCGLEPLLPDSLECYGYVCVALGLDFILTEVGI